MVHYNGKDYEIRDVTICLNDIATTVTVAKLELWGAIKHAAFGCGIERHIDDAIIYYCDDEEWAMNDEQLARVLENL